MAQQVGRELFPHLYNDAVPPSQDDDIPLPTGPEDYDYNSADAKPPGQVAAPPPIVPLETFNASDWEGVPIEPRRWVVHNRIPVGEPGIMSGDGGTGKTKLGLQLAAAIPAGLRDWIGGTIDAEGPAIVFSAEEKLKEMHRRTWDVLDHRGLSFKDLHGGLHFICGQEDVVLGAVDRNGIVQPTMSLLRLEKTIAAIRPAFVMIENAADVYNGNESDRTNVTRFVRHVLGRLTSSCDSTIMLIQHPSVSGLNDGTGRSGSTGWNNAGRWRNNFIKITDEDDNTLRQYHVVKSNYGPDGEKIKLRWDRGVFVPVGTIPTPARAAAENAAERAYLDCLDAATAQGLNVFPGTGKGYAPRVFADMPEAKGIQKSGLEAAQVRLLSAKVIWNEPFGAPSKDRRRVARKAAETAL